MSIAADTFAVAPAETAAPTDVHPIVRRTSLSKFVVAFLAVVLVGSGLRAIADAGVSQAIDNYYDKQLAAFTVPIPELVKATEDANAADSSAATAE